MEKREFEYSQPFFSRVKLIFTAEFKCQWQKDLNLTSSLCFYFSPTLILPESITSSLYDLLDLIFRSRFIICIPRIEIEDSEAVGISNIISNLITMFPRSILTALPSDLFTSFINCLTLLTCSFGRSAALEEVVSNNPRIILNVEPDLRYCF